MICIQPPNRVSGQESRKAREHLLDPSASALFPYLDCIAQLCHWMAISTRAGLGLWASDSGCATDGHNDVADAGGTAAMSLSPIHPPTDRRYKFTARHDFYFFDDCSTITRQSPESALEIDAIDQIGDDINLT